MARNNTTPASIEIRQVANGYIVTTSSSFRSGEALADEARVFQTMESLVAHLKGHFDHRHNMVLIDAHSTVPG